MTRGDVGARLDINQSWLRARGIANASQIDNITTAGVYAIGNVIEAIRDYGVLIVGDSGEDSNYGVQILFGNKLHFRIRTGSEDFSGSIWI